MPLGSIDKMMCDARSGRYAIGYFESWNLDSLQGVIDAAEQARSPVLIGFNGEFLSRPERLAPERLSWYAAIGKAAAESAGIPCALVFNECPNLDWVRQAAADGFNLVMPVSSGQINGEYVRDVAELTQYAHQRGVAVEAEIGELPYAASVGERAGTLTEPGFAAEFVQATGVDLLAVSVGNVHVLLHGRKALDLGRLGAIRDAVPVGLVLHGGTGIADESLRQAASLGVVKVNFGSCLKNRYLTAVREALGRGNDDPHRLLGFGGPEDVLLAGRLAVRDAVLKKMKVLGSCGKAC